MRSLTVPAPAKLNLFLHVTGRRADGYHQLESLFVPLDFGDTLHLTAREDGAILCTSEVPEVPRETDLCLRAAHALQDAAGCADGVEINLVKRIPVGGGLGGGSSDAASVLLALNRLWGLKLSRVRLQQIGVALGADIPFFLGPGPALVGGIGELLTAVSLPPLWVCLIAPAVIVPTAAVFAAPELTRNTPSAKITIFSEGYGRNDLQAAACARFPDVAAALAELARHSPSARMTGSGGCVFAWFGSEAEAVAACRATSQALPRVRGLVARTLAKHPLAAFG